MVLFHYICVLCLQDKLQEHVRKIQQEVASQQEYSKKQSAFKNNYIPAFVCNTSCKLECLSSLKVTNDSH